MEKSDLKRTSIHSQRNYTGDPKAVLVSDRPKRVPIVIVSAQATEFCDGLNKKVSVSFTCTVISSDPLGCQI